MRSRKHPTVFILFVTLAEAPVLVPRPADAQGQTGQDALREAARERYLRGRQLLEEGNAVGALQELAASYQLYPSWASLYGMAMCQEALGRTGEAIELYRQALREGGNAVPESERVNIGARIAELEQRIGRPAPAAATGRVNVRTTPPGAEIRIDGQPAGRAPLELDLSLGPHRVEAHLEGHASATRWINVVEGPPTVVEIELSPVAVPQEAGALLVRSDQEATAFIDDREVGPTPTERVEVAAGPHKVRIVTVDGRSWEEEVEVAAGATIVVDVRLGAAGLDPLWFWVVAGTAGALTVGGAATGGYVLSLESEYYAASTSDARRAEIKSTGDPLRVATDALLGTAGALAVGALALAFFTDFSGETRADVDVRPLAEATAGGATRGTTWW